LNGNAGWGTDEEGIIEVIGHRNAGQRKMIKEAYQSKYDEDLIRRFEKELSGDLEVPHFSPYSKISSSPLMEIPYVIK